MLNISGLQEGIVLDHIEAGKSLDIYYHLGLDKLECQVAIIKNARSNKMGRKDIIKIEGGLDTVDLKVLGYIDHNITVNIIRGDRIAEKRALKLPKKITNVIQCKNPRCITSIEQELPHIFYLADEKAARYQNPKGLIPGCHYYIIHIQSRRMYRILPYRALQIHFPVCFLFSSRAYVDRFIKGQN